MATKLKITVTKGILERSKWCMDITDMVGNNCAIACAVRDIFPAAWVVDEFISPFANLKSPLEIKWDTLKDDPFKILLPDEATDFIRDFDESTPEERANMNPISFEIEIPDSIIEKINIDELKPLLENHASLALV